jgi:hypothetical protein
VVAAELPISLAPSKERRYRVTVADGFDGFDDFDGSDRPTYFDKNWERAPVAA